MVGSYCGSYIGGTPKNAPLRCNKLTALLERRLVSFGVNSPQYEKYTIGLALEKGMGGLGV